MEKQDIINGVWKDLGGSYVDSKIDVKVYLLGVVIGCDVFMRRGCEGWILFFVLRQRGRGRIGLSKFFFSGFSFYFCKMGIIFQ